MGELRLVEEGGDIRKDERNSKQGHHDPVEDPVRPVDRRHRADLSGQALAGGPEDSPVREKHSQKRDPDEDWSIRFERREVADPGTADTEREQHQWTKAAGGGEKSGDAACDERGASGRRIVGGFRLPERFHMG